MEIRRWIPPAVVDLLGSALPGRFQRFEIAESWDAAERRCIGYEQSTLKDSDTRQHLRDGTPTQPSSRDLQFIAATGICLEASRPGGPVRVLDFGGASGHYHDVATSAFPTVSWEWTVVETPTMVRLAARDGAGISWTSDLDAMLGERWDFALASASLNYVPDPLQVLSGLCRVASHVFVTRLPLWPIDRHLPAVQRLSRADRGTYPTWFFSETVFLEQVREFGDIVLRFDVPEDTARVAGHRCSYTALVIRTKDPS